MSDTNPEETVDAMRSTAELAPILDGVSKIASDVVKRDKKVDEKLEAHGKAIKRSEQDLEDKMNKGFEDVLDRFDRFGKAHGDAVRSVLGVHPGGNPLQDVIPKEYKEAAGNYEFCASMVKSKRLQDPATYMAANRWFELASKMGLQKYRANAGRMAEELDKLNAAFDSVSKAALQEDTPGEGGNLVPTLVSNEIHRLVKDAGDIFPRARQVALQNKTTNLPSENTAVTVNWITEESALTQGEPTFSQVTVVADKLAGRAKFSIELLQDSAPMLLQYLLEVFTEKMAGELDYQLVLGDGTAPELLGIINDTNLVQDTLSTQAALTWARIADGFVAAGEKSARTTGIWICSPKGYAQILSLADSQGMPIVQFGASTQDTPAGSLLGRPIVVSNRIGGTDTLDDTTLTKTKILFGPPSSLIAGTRQGMNWDVTDAVGWANYQMDARLVGRFGGRPVVGSSFVSLENISY